MAKRVRIPKSVRIPHYWSVSSYNVWRGCAYRYMLEKILKFRGPSHPAMERGTRIHKLLEQLLKGNITGMPPDLKKMSREIRNMKKLGVVPEVSWTLTKDFQHTHPKDWKNAWLRAKIDAHHYFEEEQELLIVDLKTGRLKVSQAQMDLYAAMSPFYYPDAKNIVVELWFSDHGEVESQEYTPRQAKMLWNKWLKRSKSMLDDREFIPTVGPQCKRCPMRSSTKLENEEMGPCHEWKKMSF